MQSDRPKQLRPRQFSLLSEVKVALVAHPQRELDEAVRSRLNWRFFEGRPDRYLARAGVVMHMVDRDDHHCEHDPENPEMPWQCRFTMPSVRLPCTLVNVRAPYGLLAGAKSGSTQNKFEPWMGSSLQIGYVVAPRFAQAALRCSYPFDACSDEACPNRAALCCKRPCAFPPQLGLMTVPSTPGPCSHGCSWPARDLHKQMLVREQILARCRTYHPRCRKGHIGPGAAGSFHSELQLDPKAFEELNSTSAGHHRERHGWALAVEAIFLPASEGRAALSLAHALRAWVHSNLPKGHSPPPLLLLNISHQGIIGTQNPAPFVGSIR
jgi:hypothetical protein